MKYLIFLFIFILNPRSVRMNSDEFSMDHHQFKLHTDKIVQKYLDDSELNEKFPISEDLNSMTRFWFLIYTYFDDQKLVIHDRNNLNLIYQIHDFSSLKSKNVHPYAQAYIQEEFTKGKINALRDRLIELSETPLPTDPELISLYDQVAKSGVDLGVNDEDKKIAFKQLANNLRAQRGLKNHIEEGLKRYNTYYLFLDELFAALKVPHELIAISFLESSFNPHAHSRANAIGVWQFMPFLNKSFFPDQKNIDYRMNIGVSSVAAGFLLKENHKILKRWDLAVTAYNSGIKHLLSLRRSNPELTLSDVLENSDSSTFGFASKNFYTEFLALTRVLKFRNELFPKIQDIPPFENLHFYFTKCDVRLKSAFSLEDRTRFLETNHHLRKMDLIPKGTIISTDMNLSGQFYYKLSLKEISTKRPRLWMDPKKRYSCSTR